MNIEASALNQRLSVLIHESIAADQSYVQGKTAFWRFVGLGILALGVGSAVGLGFYGYSYVRGNSDNLHVLSATFAKALSEAQLTASAEGLVQVEPREVSLAKGQTISFDSSSRLLLDPSAKIEVDGEIQVQAPSISLPQSTATRGPAKVPTITNFTVFKRVPFEKGVVMTGWVFLTSTQKAPTNQYCYYTEDAETPGLDVVFYIAEDQKIEASKKAPKDFDTLAAFNRCVWFKGAKQ